MNSARYRAYILEFAEYTETQQRLGNSLIFILLSANIWVVWLHIQPSIFL